MPDSVLELGTLWKYYIMLFFIFKGVRQKNT